MSVPIKYCLLVKAADDPDAFNKVAPTMKRNIEGGHYTILGCGHNPPCRLLAGDEVESLMERFVNFTSEED